MPFKAIFASKKLMVCHWDKKKHAIFYVFPKIVLLHLPAHAFGHFPAKVPPNVGNISNSICLKGY